MLTSRRVFLRLTSAGILASAFSPLAFSNADAQNVSGRVPANSGFQVVADGVAQTIIVTAAAPSAVTTYAATELQQHIERATGVRLEIVAEKSAADSKLPYRLYVGPSAATENAGLRTDDLPVNGFHRKTTNKAVFLVGEDTLQAPGEVTDGERASAWPGVKLGAPPLDDKLPMGSLFAVYDWLETQLGVLWLWPGESGLVVPQTPTVFAGAVGARQVSPFLIHAQPRLSAWPGMDPSKRDKYVRDTSAWLRRQRFARGANFSYGHAFTKYWERFGETHPEYFALRPAGVRAPFDPKRPQLVQMCVSNPGLHQQIIADWLIQREKGPSAPWVNGIENDKTANDSACTCAVCHSWDPPNQASLPLAQKYSDRYARFWLALQEEAKKHDPDATVIGYAYADYSAQPAQTKLNRNIVVGIVPPYSFPASEQERESFHAVWDGWAKTGARLYLRPNYLLSGYDVPYNFAEQFGDEFKFAAQRGMIATDFDSLLGMWGVHGLNLYMVGRLNARPEMSVAQVLNEYYSGFGPAGGAVRRYFEYWKTITNRADSDFRKRVQGGWGFISKAGDELYTPATFENGRALLDEAKKAAAGEADVLPRIEFLALWLEHARLSMATLAAFHAQQKNPQEKQLQTAFAAAKTALDEYRSAHADEIVNVGVLRQLEVWAGWRKSAELVR